MSNTSIPIEKFIFEAVNVLETLYQDNSGAILSGINDFLKIPVNEKYIGDINRFLKDEFEKQSAKGVEQTIIELGKFNSLNSDLAKNND